MKYEDLIIRILIEAGDDGLSVRKVTRHVYNAVNGFFEEADWGTVHRVVRAFLHRHSRGMEAAISRPKHGVYCLNLATQAGKNLVDSILNDSATCVESQTKEVELSLPFLEEDEL